MTQSARMKERFERRKRLRQVSAFLYIASSAAYLAWRATIINQDAQFLSGMYFVSDVIAVLLGVLTIFVSWHYKHRTSPPAQPGRSVDVFVTTYQEPVDMVRRTLSAAAGIRYPHKTWLLDDGDRPQMKALAAELGCNYLARKENKGAKAGNLNHALAHSDGEFVAVFDADHIPLTNALDATLGFFDDPSVAMVQTPQDYFNTDALQYLNPKKGGLWHDQSFFYNLSQPGRDHYNAASCAGTSVVYRRTALEAIGGIPEETVTEDVHTSLRLHKAGFKAPYLNEPIAHGVAAADLRDYYRTRLRYGHGNIHALRTENVLTCKGLTFSQRISYLFLGLIYLEGWQQLMVFLVPAIALIFGIAPFEITIFNVLVVLTFPIWSYLLMQEIGCGFSRYWTAEIYSMIRWPVHIIAAAALFTNRMVWRGSRKNIEGELQLVLLIPQVIVLILSVTAVIVGFYRLEGRYEPGPLVAAVTDRLPDREAVTEAYRHLEEELRVAGRDIRDAVFTPSPEQLAAAGPEGSAEGTAEPADAAAAASPDGAVSSPPRTGDSVPPTARPERSAAETSPEGSKQPAISDEVASPPATIEPQEPQRKPRAEPKPVEWFQPLTKGYTIDLVLIAGFWALVNALRVVLVIAKVADNARKTGADYLFHTLLPVRIRSGGRESYFLAEYMSADRIKLSGSPKLLSQLKLEEGVPAEIFLPTGAARVRLHPIMAATGARPSRFRIETLADKDSIVLENGLFATGWHRECRHHEAEFITLSGVIARLLRIDRRDRKPWQAVLVLDSEAPSSIGLYRDSGELIILGDSVMPGSVIEVAVIGRKGWRLLKLRLNSTPVGDELAFPLREPMTMYRFETENLARRGNIFLFRRKNDPAIASHPEADEIRTGA